jgi:hypothetical protein
MDIGFAELLLVMVPVWGFAAFVGYWVIRLAVRNGTLDAYRIDRTAQRTASVAPRGVSETIRRQRARYGLPESE